jgi:predicted SAM-dependent methyltransferase
METESNDFCMSWIRTNERRKPFKRYLIKILPNHLLERARFEFHMLFVRLWSWNMSRAYHGRSELLVNIGAGRTGKNGWVNLDGFKNRGVNCRYDARKRLPFPDNSVRGIFSEHFFEHIEYTEEVPIFLTECYRVLKDGGVIRIIVPDAEKYLQAYARGGWQELTSLRPLGAELRYHYFHYKYNTRMELINVIFRQSQEHKFSYDFETIEFILNRYGFSEITKSEFGRSVDPEMCIDLEERATESLYVEAIKKAA